MYAPNKHACPSCSGERKVIVMTIEQAAESMGVSVETLRAIVGRELAEHMDELAQKCRQLEMDFPNEPELQEANYHEEPVRFELPASEPIKHSHRNRRPRQLASGYG